MSRLDPDDARPPYSQVVEALRNEIEQGALPPGAKLPTHQELVAQFGVSVGTIKRALGELQGAGLILSRQGQGAYVRTRRTLLESIPHSFPADTLSGLWISSYRFNSASGIGVHADITRVTAQSSRRVTAKNYPPDPRTQGHVPSFRNEIEAQLANRHLIGHWRNLSDTRYFGSIQLAVLPGEAVMEGYYTSFANDIHVDAMPWKWVRLDPASVAAADLSQVALKEPEVIHALLEHSAEEAPLSLSAVVEGGA